MQADSLFLRAEDRFWRAPMKGVRFAVLAAVLIGIGFVLFADKPWSVTDAMAERDAAGKKSLLTHDVTRGLWFGFFGCALAGAALLGTWKRWCRPLDGPARPVAAPAELIHPVTFWFLATAAVVLGGWARWNLANRSLWWDELWSLKHASLGYLKQGSDPATDELQFLKRDWTTTLWGYRKPTNHPPVSIASRVSQSIWRARSGAAEHEFNELAVRAPTWLAGLASILSIALLVRRWGFAIGGLGAAFFLALHPWHMRYGTEARAYSFAVLWTILGCLWLTYALSDGRGRWRYWLLFGLNQLLITWSLPNGFFYAMAFTLAGVVVIFHQWADRTGRIAAVWRLLAVNVMAAMAYLPLFTPNILQALRWGEVNDYAFLTWSGLKNALCQLCFGMDGDDGGAVENADRAITSAGIPSFAGELAESPWGAWPALVLLLLGLAVGIYRICTARPGAAAMLGALIVAAAVSLLVTKIAGMFFYPRYIIYTLVPLAALFGIGLAGFSRAITAKSSAAFCVGIAVLTMYFISTRSPRALLFSRPYAPFKEVAQHLESRTTGGGSLHVIGYGLGGRMLGMYYPRTAFAKNKSDLEREIERAQSMDSPYVIVLGYEWVNREAPEYMDGFEIIDRPGAFTESRSFSGIEPMFYFRILDPVP